MKLPIMSEDVGAKIACGRGTGNNFIISDGLIIHTHTITNQENCTFMHALVCSLACRPYRASVKKRPPSPKPPTPEIEEELSPEPPPVQRPPHLPPLQRYTHRMSAF